MERWQQAFAQNDKDFKELFGVKKDIFLPMHAVLTATYHERHQELRVSFLPAHKKCS